MEPTPRPYVSDSSAPNGRLDKRPHHLLAKQHSSGSVKTSQREKQAVGYPVVLICCWNPLVKCEFSMHFWPETGPSDQLYSSEDSHYWQRAVPSYQHSVLWCISWKVKPCPAESNIHRTGHHTWQSAVNRQPWRPGAWMDLSWEAWVGHGCKRNLVSFGWRQRELLWCLQSLLVSCRYLGEVSFSCAGAMFPPVNLQSHTGMLLFPTLPKNFKFAGSGAGFSGIYWLAPCSCLFCLCEIVLPWPCLCWFSNKPCLEAAVLYAVILSVLLA